MSDTKSMKRVVIIPTYNEIENIEAMIEKVFSLPMNFDLLIIDDGSPDGTATVVHRLIREKYQERLHIIERTGKQGLGTAYIVGFRWALEQGYDFISEMDCDFSHNPDDLIRLSDAIEAGADVVVGSRYVTGVNVVNWPMGRVIMSYYASKYVRCMLRVKIRDCTAGFVAYRSEVLRTINLDDIRMKGYGFQIEMKYTAHKLGFTIKEVPIIFTDRTQGTSKMSGGIFGEAFWGVMKMRFRKFKPVDNKAVETK
ncbi:MAG: polyprenol monophosphomannose synthase [Rikenellaceae bacterium]